MNDKWFRLAVIVALLFWGCVQIEQYRVADNCKEVIAVHTVCRRLLLCGSRVL